jgi:hypothetical protein
LFPKNSRNDLNLRNEKKTDKESASSVSNTVNHRTKSQGGTGRSDGKKAMLALAVGALAAKKAYGLSKAPIASTKNPEKVQIHAVIPKGNKWVVVFSYWYNDSVGWSKSERVISKGIRGVSAGAFWIDVDWR